MTPKIELHLVSIEPPDQMYIHYRVTCSQKDLNRSAKTRIDAMEISVGHIHDLVLKCREELAISEPTSDELKGFRDMFARLAHLTEPLEDSSIEA